MKTLDFQLLAELLGTEAGTAPAQSGCSEFSTAIPAEGDYAKRNAATGSWERWYIERGSHFLERSFSTLKELIVASMWDLNLRGMPRTLGDIEPALRKAQLEIPIEHRHDGWVFGDIAVVSKQAKESDDLVVELTEPFPLEVRQHARLRKASDRKFVSLDERRATSIVFIAVCDRLTC